jgi:hypothetical protein
MPLRELLIDAWTALDFKRLVGSGRLSATSTPWPSLVPSWVGPRHQRRLQAYALLQAYRENSSRFFLDTQNEQQRSDHREYGDAELLVQQVRASLIGDRWSIGVEGADETAPPAPPRPLPAPAVLPPGAPDPSPEIDPTHPLADPEPPDPATVAALERQDFLRKWGRNERFGMKLLDVEAKAIGLGDGVYLLGWSTKKKRPRLRVFDPGFYFPVLDDDIDDDEYPDTVHLAWEVPPRNPDDTHELKLVRRITYQMTPVADWRPKWNDDDDPPATMECYLTDAVFELDALKRDVEDLSPARARYRQDELGQEIRDLPLGIDFLPVIHLPNTVNLSEHFGKSVLTTILQIVDDLANADTDLQAASATAGSPPLALAGSSLGSQNKTYGPGTVFETGDGKMSVLDTTAGITAIIQYVEFLLDRLSVNGRVPASVLGRVDPQRIEAGVILQLSFGPLTTLIEEMRLVREEKYGLLFKFVQRFFVQAGELPDVMDAGLEFGSYLPSDKAGAVQHVTALLGAKAISLVTTIKILTEAGFPVEDAATELARIVEEQQKISVATTPPQLQQTIGPDGKPLPPGTPSGGGGPGGQPGNDNGKPGTGGRTGGNA